MAIHIRRREFIFTLGGTAASWPLVARAQQASSVLRLGVLLYSNPQADHQMETIRGALRDLGHIEGRNIVIEYRYAQGKPERLPELAAQLVRLRPDVILAIGGDVAEFAKKATQTVPLVFISSADPEQLGLVASLGRPGGNATGVTLLQDELASKRLELLKEAAPRVSQVAFLWNPDHPDNELREAQRAAQALGIKLHPIEVRRTGDFDGAFRRASDLHADALYVVSSRHTVLNLPLIVEFATKDRVPLAGGWGDWAKAGGLLSYGPNVGVMARGATMLLDKTLKGAKPADLPVLQPTKFELVINLKTAKALGLEVPPILLSRADEVIE